MKTYMTAGTALLLTTSIAAAGGLDRSGQSVLSIFNEDGTSDVSLGYIMPSVTGTDGTVNYDVGASYIQLGASYTGEINSDLSFGLIYDQPFGADIFYNGDPSLGTLSGTKAALESDAFSAIAKYQIDNRFSVFGGLRAQRVSGEIGLNGTAYQSALATAGVAGATAAAIPGLTTEILGGALAGVPAAVAGFNALRSAAGDPAGTDLASLGAAVTTQSAGIAATGGYQLQLDDDWGLGYSFGVAYEIPDIALRAAITYHSEVDHDNSTSEDIGGANTASTIDFFTPQSVNVEFQTGIAENTLLNASLRWTNWGDFDVIPTRLGTDLADLDDSYRWSLGIARRFSEEFAGSLTVTYEATGDGSTVSPLGPNDGQIGISLGGRYESDGMTISGGVNYTMLGDADAGVGGQAVASFTDSTALAVGLKVAYSF
ncbi:outer membrane protein transport protein [Octadecabacter sp. G9-8]|uniref:Outer membrane protein transport protein n=1 Tax=Octadecabacter dasysiphoniae TaxID=2909341 RepID=A0ABS9CX40_9RHOB|nr:outer membrane protein transport protein [Octadecabacter dasysiphoniae]MCF2870736.1 outer membrane protein transport protein [Octadecabacter dasysiphoniae]